MVLFVVASFLALSRSPVYAAADAQRWVCLNAEHCLTSANCSATHKGNGHIARLSAKTGFEPIAGIDTYVVVCIATANDQICTTGTAASDQKVYGKSNYDTLHTSLGFNYEGLFKANGTDSVTNPAIWAGPYEWGDSLPASHMHKWLAMNFYDPKLFAAGGNGGQQQGTFNFDTAEKDCVKIAWDPYGRIFDAGTLEPVTAAQVTLYVKKGTSFVQMVPGDVPGGNLTNPQWTLEDGNFSYVVPDGDYKIMVNPPAVTDISQVDVNYSKAYFDIYPAATGDVIAQRGGIQHRDIPVAAASTSATPKMMEYFYQADNDGSVSVQGRVSHPLSRLIAGTSKVSTSNPSNVTPYRTVATFFADRWGKFSIKLDQNKFEKTDDYIEIFSNLEIQKVDMRINGTAKVQPDSLFAVISRFIRQLLNPVSVEAQSKTTVISFNPIPQFLDGYAYDTAGKPMPNAMVGLFLTISNKPYSQVYADETGHFVFPPQLIPNFAYTIKYMTATGQTVETTTTKFLAQNQKYMAKNSINPYVSDTPNNQASLAQFTAQETLGTPGDTGGSSSASSTSRTGTSSTGYRRTSGTSSTSSIAAPAQPPTSSNPMIVVVMLLILLLGGVAAGVLLFMKNKQTMPPQW